AMSCSRVLCRGAITANYLIASTISLLSPFRWRTRRVLWLLASNEFTAFLQCVKWRLDALMVVVAHVVINFRLFTSLMTQKLLVVPQISPAFNQSRFVAVTQPIQRHRLADAHFLQRQP